MGSIKFFLGAFLIGILFSGCASTERESDLPWNMTQPWETAPTLPFGGGSGY